MTGSFLLLVTTVGSALLIGLIPALLTRLRPALASGLGITEEKVDRLKTGFLWSLVPFMLSAGWAVDRFGAREVLFVGNLLAALGVAALGLRPSFHSTIWVVLVLGLAASCVTCAGITLMPLAFWGHPKETAASLNLGFIAVGIGALLAPMLCHLFLNRLGFRQCLLSLAFLCLLPAAFTIFTAKAEFPQDPQTAESASILGEPILWLACLVMLLYYPLEGSLDTWVKSYLANLGHNEKTITRWHAVFWGTFLAARLGAGLYLDYRYEAWVIFFLVLAAAIALGNLAGAYGARSARELILVGAFLGSILPTFLGTVLSVEKFEGAHGTVVGILFTLGTLSTLLVQPLLSRLARNSVQVAMRVPLALALAVAVPCFILALVVH